MRKPTPSLIFLPPLSALIAFILSVLCLFAGSKTNLLVDADILTLYTPDVGNDAGISDFYSIYVMTYCEGGLGTTDDDPLAKTNFTQCSNRTIPFAFDPTNVLLEESGNKISLDELGWPSAVSGDFRVFSLTSQAMAIFYCLGAGIVGVSFLARLWFWIWKGPRQSIFELSGLLLSFGCLAISSIIATVYAFQFVTLINYHGDESNVTASYGKKFLGMTWAAVGILLLGSMVYVLVDHTRPEYSPHPRTQRQRRKRRKLNQYDPEYSIQI